MVDFQRKLRKEKMQVLFSQPPLKIQRFQDLVTIIDINY